MSEQAIECAIDPDAVRVSAVDLAQCLSTIDTAARSLDTNLARVRDLQAQVRQLTQQQAAMADQLAEAACRSATLETALAIEQAHSSRAEALAEAAAARANDLEVSAFEAFQKLAALTAAIAAAFDDVPEEIDDRVQAAA